MRKTYALILASCLSVFCGRTLLAGPVSPGRALEIGQNLLADSPATRTGSNTVSIVWDGEFEGSRTTAAPAFYVIARDGGGFVIIAGNDNVTPILGFSETGQFESKDMPSHVKWFMNRLKTYVRSSYSEEPGVRARWAALQNTRANASVSSIDENSEVRHPTPEWYQGANYNDVQLFNKYCPIVDGKYCLTGCVATALAEILTTLSGIYPEDMPTSGSGLVGGYSIPEEYAAAGFVVPSQYELTTEYDWAGLRLLTKGTDIGDAVRNNNLEILDNLSHLMADCGAAVEAMYTPEATSAFTDYRVTGGMSRHLGMSKTAHTEYADSYSSAQWKQLLKTDLAQRPLLYSGVSVTGGHAFVLDGYATSQGQDVFYVNFGWLGNDNGFYFIDHLLTSGNGDFANGCDVILDFYPDKQGATSYRPNIAYYSITYENVDYYGITADQEIKVNEPFGMFLGGLWNAGSVDYTGSLILQFEDKNGDRLADWTITDFSSSSFPPGSVTLASYSFTLEQEDFVFGNRFVAYYSDGNDLRAIKAPDNGLYAGELPVIPAAFIKTKSRYAPGDLFEFRLMNYGKRYAGTTWTITGPDGDSAVVSQSSGEYRFAKSGKYKIVASIKASADSEIVENVVTFVTVE